MAKPSENSRSKLRWLLAPGSFLAVLLAVAFLWQAEGEPDAAQRAAPSSAASSTGYVIEDGVVAWRPMSAGEQLAVNILTLGATVNSEVVRGRSLPLADAASFRTIGASYGLDQSRVWFGGALIEGADPASFEVLDLGFSRDSAHIWQGAARVMPLPSGQPNTIDIHSGQMLSINTETFLLAERPLQLPERPAAAPTHFCRDWFMMNDAVWLRDRKLLPVEGDVTMLDCDGSINTSFVDGVPREITTHNKGLTVLANGAVRQLSRAGDATLIATMPEPVTETLLPSIGFQNDDLLLARGASGTIYAVGLPAGTPVQPLGQFDALPDSDAIISGRAFWLGGHYFTRSETSGPAGPVVTDHGPAERLGDLALVDGVLYDRTQVLARPGDLPLRSISIDTVLIGAACYRAGSYVTDVPDPAAEPEQILQACNNTWPTRSVLYDGLRIAFEPALTRTGPSKANPDMVSFELGEITLVNETDRTQTLPAAFLQNIELNIHGTPIAHPDDAWDEQGLRLEPQESHRWTLLADSDAELEDWGWTLSMRHNAARAQVFDNDPFYIGTGRLVP